MAKQQELSRPFKKFGRYGYNVSLPDFPVGDDVDALFRSRLYLYEDGQPIGEKHHNIEGICTLGHGKFVHWKQDVFFSTLDTTDPNINGRDYAIAWSDELYFKEHCAHFHDTLVTLLAAAQLKPCDLAGKNVLEIGGGIRNRQCGLGLLAVGYGANVVAVDREAVSWDDDFHPGFIDCLIRQGPSLGEGFAGERLKIILDRRDFTAKPFTVRQADFNSRADILPKKYDIQLSALSLRQFKDLEQVVTMLFRTAEVNAIGCHSIDFRDFRDPINHPLEFLILSDEAFKAISVQGGNLNGNRGRPKELEHLFNRAGFVDVRTHPIRVDVDPSYMNVFLPRLRSSGSRFSAESAETLRQFRLIYTMSRPAVPPL